MDTYLETTGFIERKVLFKKKNENIYCIGSRNSDRYLYASNPEANVIYFILHEIDMGTCSNKIMQLSKDKFNLGPTEFDKIILKCKEVGLIKKSEDEKVKKDIDEFELMLVNLKDFSLKKLYPTFSVISKGMKLITVFMVCIIAGAVFSLFGYNNIEKFPWDDIFSKTNALFYMWIIQFLCLVLHEFSHAVVGYKYGARPKSFSIAVFYYSMVIFYIRLPGIYFQNEKERVKIWTAGMFMNLFMAACFWLLFLTVNGNAKLFFAVGTISNIMLVLNNIIPFFYSDGYYILTTLLKTPNLRKRSIFQIKKLIKNGFTKQNTIYWTYLLVTALVIALIFGGQILIIIKSMYNCILKGTGFIDVLNNYSNLLIIMSIGIVGKIIGKVKKRYHNGGYNNE